MCLRGILCVVAIGPFIIDLQRKTHLNPIKYPTQTTRFSKKLNQKSRAWQIHLFRFPTLGRTSKPVITRQGYIWGYGSSCPPMLKP